MKRREFLKYTGILGLGSLASLSSRLDLYAAPPEDNYSGPLWLIIDAEGGWDPTILCDPKTAPINTLTSGVLQIPGSDIQYASPLDSPDIDPSLYYSAETFFTKYYKELLVINGVDTGTVSHSDGKRNIWSGELGRVGYPSFGALVAGVLANNKSMPYIANGGYNVAANLTTPIRLSKKDINAIFEIAFPNRSIDPALVSSDEYIPAATQSLIKAMRQDRTNKLISEQNLPKLRTSLEKFLFATNSGSDLQGFANNLSDFTELARDDFIINSNPNNLAHYLYLQGHIALAAYQSGVSASAHIRMSGFDTHDNHDARHYPRLMQLLQGIDAILDEAKTRGLSDKIVVIMGSDFGRTNKYNANLGKDHWPITSMMFIGNSIQKIDGNRVVGSTTKDHKAINIDPITLLPDPQNGVRLTPAHIHHALRKLAGVEISSAASNFGLKGQFIDLFNKIV